MTTMFPNLLSPLHIGNIEVRNRLVSTAHQTRLGRGHRPTPELAAYHAARARGGIGLIILEGAWAHPTTLGDQYTLIAYDEEAIPHFRMVVDAIHDGGAKVFGQIIHLGRASDSTLTRRPLWSASRVHNTIAGIIQTSETTHAMTVEDIQEMIRWYCHCASNFKRAGVDGVEIHGAHGYLVQQFLSPLTNFRTDEYGGSLRNRTRFALELAHAVRQVVGRDRVLGMRLSADELMPGGLAIEDTTQIARWLEEAGDLDYLNITHSTTEPSAEAQQVSDMSEPQGKYVHLAAAIKKATKGIPIFTVGRIVDPVMAENIVADGKADMVCMMRAHVADPEIGLKLSEGRPEDIRQCIGCNQVCGGGQFGCTINPEATHEHELGPISPAARKKAVVVVGGGPAGMEAARVAALRGHLVALYESRERLGGQITTLIKAPHRVEFGNVVAWLEYQLKRLGVVVKLNSEATPESLSDEGTEAVIIATGSVPHLPEIPGAGQPDGPRLVSTVDVLEKRVPFGKRAILLDSDWHFKAVGTAKFLAEQGVQVHMVTRASGVGGEIRSTAQILALTRLKQKRIAIHRESWVKQVSGRTVVLEDLALGDEERIEDVDLIVVAAPNKASTELYDRLTEAGRIPEIIAVGDCVVPRRATEAMREGHMAGRAL